MNDEDLSRRAGLKFLGFGALGLAGLGALGSTPAAAQDLSGTAIGRTVPRALYSKTLADPRAVASLHLGKALPSTTRIGELGLTRDGIALLTPGARTLIKADLVSMQQGRLTAASTRLTVADIGSIQAAFGKGLRPAGGLAAADVSLCCCCTPCCCAAAVEPELALAA